MWCFFLNQQLKDYFSTKRQLLRLTPQAMFATSLFYLSLFLVITLFSSSQKADVGEHCVRWPLPVAKIDSVSSAPLACFV